MLIILRGTSNSFKSTFAKKYFKNSSIVCLDNIRKELFGNCNYFKEELLVKNIYSSIINSRLKHGLDVLVDSVNLHHVCINSFVNMALENNVNYIIISFKRGIEDTISGSILRSKLNNKSLVLEKDIRLQSKAYDSNTPLIINKHNKNFFEFKVKDISSLEGIYDEYKQIRGIIESNETVSRFN